MPITPVSSFRLPHETKSQIRDLRETKQGRLPESAVIIAAVDTLHRSVYGRRSADMTPLRRRPAKG